MARDRVQGRTPRERSESAAAASRELVAGDALSAGERAVTLAGLAQAEATLAHADATAMLADITQSLIGLLADRLPSGPDVVTNSDLRQVTKALESVAVRLADGRR